MKLYHDSSDRERLVASDSRTARMLLDDDWRPLSEYRYDRKYVYAAAINGDFRYRCLPARGGRYQSSQWWTPWEKEIPTIGLAGLTVTHWKPLPADVDPYNPTAHWYELSGVEMPDPLARAPEPVYEPAPPTERLTPGPRDLLVAMRDGAVLRERGKDWSSFTLTKPGGAPAKITYRPIRPLAESAFIVLDGTLPPRKDRWYDVAWKITEAGHAWLVANVR